MPGDTDVGKGQQMDEGRRAQEEAGDPEGIAEVPVWKIEHVDDYQIIYNYLCIYLSIYLSKYLSIYLSLCSTFNLYPYLSYRPRSRPAGAQRALRILGCRSAHQRQRSTAPDRAGQPKAIRWWIWKEFYLIFLFSNDYSGRSRQNNTKIFLASSLSNNN